MNQSLCMVSFSLFICKRKNPCDSHKNWKKFCLPQIMIWNFLHELCMVCLHKGSFSASLLGVGNLEYAVVRKSAKMIGSLFLLNRQCPTVKQRTTAVIHNAKLMLYNNGKNPKVLWFMVKCFDVRYPKIRPLYR